MSDIVERLRNTPNWMREAFGSWKSAMLSYDRAPFAAADEIEKLRAALKQAADALHYAGAKARTAIFAATIFMAEKNARAVLSDQPQATHSTEAAPCD